MDKNITWKCKMFLGLIICIISTILCFDTVKANTVKINGGEEKKTAKEVGKNVTYTTKVWQASSGWFKFKTPNYDSYLSLYAKELLNAGSTVTVYTSKLKELESESLENRYSDASYKVNMDSEYKLKKNTWYYIEFYNGLTRNDDYKDSKIEFKIKFVKDLVGNTIDDASAISSGKAVKGSILRMTDIDWYCFKPQKNGIYKFSLKNTGKSGMINSCITDSKKEFYDFAKETVKGKSCSYNLKLNKGKSYYIGIWGSNKSQYQVLVKKSSATAYTKPVNPADSTRKIAPNKYYNVSFKSKGDIFWYKIKTPSYKSECMLDLPYFPGISVPCTINLYSNKFEMLEEQKIRNFSGNTFLGYGHLKKNTTYYIKIKFDAANKNNLKYKIWYTFKK